MFAGQSQQQPIRSINLYNSVFCFSQGAVGGERFSSQSPSHGVRKGGSWAMFEHLQSLSFMTVESLDSASLLSVVHWVVRLQLSTHRPECLIGCSICRMWTWRWKHCSVTMVTVSDLTWRPHHHCQPRDQGTAGRLPPRRGLHTHIHTN